jgi:DNA mismatch repair protein MutS
VSISKRTPFVAQWQKFRRQYDESYVIAFRMGDFYEFFSDDAKIVSKILDLTLTDRQGIPLAGFPYASGQEALEKIVKAGRPVIVVDQVEDPAEAKGRIVERDIVRIITPGTLLDDNVLEQNSNNFLAALVVDGIKGSPGSIRASAAFCDLSTGEFFTMSFTDTVPRLPVLTMEFSKNRPVEVLVPESLTDEDVLGLIPKIIPGIAIRRRSVLDFDVDEARRTLLEHFKVTNLESFGIESNEQAIAAAGAVIIFLRENQRSIVSNITTSMHVSPADYLQLDHNTIRNLEILNNIVDGSARGTLFDLFSSTCTIMGARRLKKMFLSPLMNSAEITERLDFADDLIRDMMALNEIKNAMAKICDLERLISKINYSTAINARHLLQLANSLDRVPDVRSGLQRLTSRIATDRAARLGDFGELVSRIKDTFLEDPSTKITEGGMIREGVNSDLDELRELRSGSEQWLERFQEETRKKYGITNLRVKNNSVFGYFIEVSNSYVDKVPDTWTRKQTLVNAERYINPELKEMETKILTAEEKIFDIEKNIFLEVKALAIEATARVQETASIVAEIDALLTMASVAGEGNYVRPEITTDGTISILEGRHPTIEKIIGVDKFIPNDVNIDPARNVLSIVTGPNMSGKSTFLRQTCLIVLLAQVGSFVPAKQASIGIVDKIFSRVGAQDDITRERSTFMVEMNECAYILNHATKQSLVILDELGRGTSTFDGVSLAWAVAEYLQARSVKTLFATHYHQLADLESFLPRTKNLTVLVKENESTKELLFLHKVIEGSCDKSYGIQVAKLAGLPAPVITRAEEILKKLTEDDPLTTDRIKLITEKSIASPGQQKGTKKTTQTILFPIMKEDHADPLLKEMREELAAIDLNTMTPFDALALIKRFKERIDGNNKSQPD